MTDPTREHARRVLEATFADDTERDERIVELEAAGHRIVDGGEVDGDEWIMIDWRTRDVLATGTGGQDEYETVGDRLDPDDLWIHIDKVEYGFTEVSTEGVPDSLQRAIEDWIGSRSTPDADIAAWIGWTIEKVTDYRG